MFYYYSQTPINLYPKFKLLYNIKKYYITVFKNKRFSTSLIGYIIPIVIRFIEYCTGSNFYFKLYPFILKTLTFFEILRCLL